MVHEAQVMDDLPARPLTIGWTEHVDFPDWGIRRLRVKIDTGARTSAIDVASYELRSTPSEGLVAELRLALHRKHPQRIKVVQLPVLRMVVVRSTSGIQEERPLIETRMRLGPIVKLVQLTITRRADMRFPVILGRRALAGDFIVDVNRKNLL